MRFYLVLEEMTDVTRWSSSFHAAAENEFFLYPDVNEVLIVDEPVSLDQMIWLADLLMQIKHE